MIRISVLSLSLLTIMSGAAVAPALADIIAFFPGAPKMLGKMVLTTPALTIIPVALLTGMLSSRISRKPLIYTGIILYIAGGFGGGMADSIPFLLIMRGVLGIGVGILMPLSTGIIADIWQGYEKTKTMGYSSASNNLGGIIATLLSGLLAAISWRASFCIYLLGLPVLLLVFLYMPGQKPKKISNKKKGKGSGNIGFYTLWGLSMFLLMVAFYAIPVNIALYIKESGLGDSKMAGLAMSVMTGSSFLTGLVFGRLNKTFGKWLSTISLGAFGISFYGLSAYPSLIPVFFFLILNGIGFGILAPTIMNNVTKKAGESSGTSGTSVVTSFLFAGQFFSPLISGGLSSLLFGPGISEIYLTIALAGIMATIISLFSNMILPDDSKQQNFKGGD